MKRTTMTLMLLLLLLTGKTNAENVTFNARSWDSTNQAVKTESKTEDCVIIEGENNEWQGLGEKGKTTYYAVKGNVKRKTLNCFGEVHLIVTDGATLTCTGGIRVSTDTEATLHIHSQSDGDNQGRIIASNSYWGAAAIGAGKSTWAGSIFIHGGRIKAVGGDYAAGIGGAFGAVSGGYIAIYGGDIDAQGGESGAGIGRGSADDGKQYEYSHKIEIFGGIVKAKGGDLAAGIGGGGNYDNFSPNKWGCGCDGSHVVVRGGKVYAWGGHRAAGIGSGSAVPSSSTGKKLKPGWFEMSDGYVEAYGGDFGAGIGGGCNVTELNFGDFILSGGTVKAYGGKDAAGIGGGEDGHGLAEIKISGGTLLAVGKGKGAGIGGGQNGHPRWASYAINGGDVTVIAGEDCNGRNADEGSAIGNGYGAKRKNDYFEQFTIGDKCKVVAGDNEDNTTSFTSEERINACIWRNYAHITPCNHGYHHYQYIDDNTHRYYCEYCKSDVQVQEHNYGSATNPHDCVCGKKFNTNTDRIEITFVFPKNDGTDGYDHDHTTTIYLLKDQSYKLPEAPKVPGWQFMGYSSTNHIWTGFALASSIEMFDAEEGQLQPEGSVVTPNEGLIYFPRYRKIYVEEWAWNVDYEHLTATASLKITNAIDGEDTKVLTPTVTNNTTEATETAPGELNFTATASFTTSEGSRTYKFTNSMKEVYYILKDITLDAAASNNSEILEEYDDMGANVTMSNLTLKKDGKLHALTLPFSTPIAGSPLEGATVYVITNVETVNKQLQLKFTPVTDQIEAGMPYFVKWTSGSDIVNPTFHKVYLKNQTMGIQDREYEFCGTYDMLVNEDDLKGYTYILDANSELVQSDLIDGFSNYFMICPEKAWDGSQDIHTVQLNFNDEQKVTKRISYGFKGEGTAESPFLIRSKLNLQEMIAAFNGEEADEMKGKYFRQEVAIEFDKDEVNNLTPITSFTGHYDGDGYVISGLNINKTGSDNAALFLTMADGSSLKNLIIKNSIFTGSTAAAITCNMNGSASIDNCHVTKDVTITSNNHFAAGIAAYMQTGTPSIKNCSSQAVITAHQSSAAGVVAFAQGNVSNCIYLGNSITHGNSAQSKAVAYINNGIIENCYYLAPILNDANAKLMPSVVDNIDNSHFLTLLHERDTYLSHVLEEADYNYALTLNGCEYQAVKNGDTWSRRAFTLCLPFDMAIPTELQQKVEVYTLHEIDLDRKVFLFTNDFPILKAGNPYILVVKEGSITFSAKNELITVAPMETEPVYSTNSSTALGLWQGTFQKLDNEQLVAQKGYIMQKNGTFRHIDKIYASQPYVAQYLAYFTALSPIGTSFKMKFIRTENGSEVGQETDFPADEFVCDVDLGEEGTGIDSINSDEEADTQREVYNLNGQRVAHAGKGIFIINGKKIVHQ